MKFDYTIIKSKRRSIAVEISRECKITVRAPLHYPDEKILEFVNSKSEWIEKHFTLQMQRKENFLKATVDEAELRKKAHEIIPEKVEYYSGVMGLFPSSVKITSAKKRLGSCSGKNAICFSYLLMIYPQEAIDYVVVHELAHIKFHNHSKNFYKLIEKYLPDYKKRVKMIKQK